MFKLKKSKIFYRFRKNLKFFQKKAISNTTILSIITVIVIVLIFLLLTSSFSKKVGKADISAYTCKLPGTDNRCCLPSDEGVIPANVGKWEDCEEPNIACCVG